MQVDSVSRIVPPDPLPPVVRHGYTPPAGSPAEFGLPFFVSHDSCYSCGIWEGEEGTIPIEYYPVTEFCVLLSGQVTLEDSSGSMTKFGAGDTFVIPEGFSGKWHMTGRTRKYFASYGKPELMRVMIGLPPQ
jgi:uncharacterized cupin superfamily protein